MTLSMAIAIAEVAATGADLRDSSAQDAIVQRWYAWSRTAKDVGIQTGSVLTAAARNGVITAARARAESAKLYERTGRAAGNGSLMRTAPVALAYLDDEDAMVEAARAISELTHFDPDAGDACVLWCSAIRHAVLTGELDVRIGLRHIESGRRGLWSSVWMPPNRLAPRRSPTTAGWSRRCRPRGRRSPRPRYPSTIPALECSAPTTLAWRWTPRSGLGYDTDTVAAIAGGLLGAAYGASAVPGRWRYAAARLAGYHRPWTGGACDGHRAQGKAGWVRLLVPGFPDRHLRAPPI